jgi:hypothetical protein
MRVHDEHAAAGGNVLADADFEKLAFPAARRAEHEAVFQPGALREEDGAAFPIAAEHDDRRVALR